MRGGCCLVKTTWLIKVEELGHSRKEHSSRDREKTIQECESVEWCHYSPEILWILSLTQSLDESVITICVQFHCHDPNETDRFVLYSTDSTLTPFAQLSLFRSPPFLSSSISEFLIPILISRLLSVKYYKNVSGIVLLYTVNILRRTISN